MSTEETTRQLVIFSLGSEEYALPITRVQEIIRYTEPRSVASQTAWIRGVINLRGKIVSVLDLRKRFGLKTITTSRRNRILVVEHDGHLAGLIVDSASEVLKIPAADIEPSPSVLQEGGSKWVTGMAKCNGRLIVLLDVAAVLDFKKASADQDVKPQAEARSASAGK